MQFFDRLGANQKLAYDGIEDSLLLGYLLHGKHHRDRSGVIRLNRRLKDDHMKLLNLCHDWLATFLPHTLAKIDRVHFGLLSPRDLAQALARDPRMPESRRLLAVPFVGKDVPSRASEFAHPDVVIGLAVLAYRYEGLRRTDFETVLEALRARMEARRYKRSPHTLFFGIVEH